MADLITSITELLRADFAAEAKAGFPAVGRIPSTETVKFLDYFGGLNSGERGALLDAMARLGATQFFPPPVVYRDALDFKSNNPALVRYRNALQSGHFAYGLRYAEPRMARMMLSDPEGMAQMAETRSGLDFQPRDDPPKELVPDSDIRKVRPAKAPLLRKLMETSFAQLFSPRKDKLPGGETRYAGAMGSTELTVSVDFASRLAQMRWFVKMKMVNPNLLAFRIEDFWGRCGWDYLTEENASRSIDLLCERVEYLVRLKERIDAIAE
jgi:hypothetical protein